MPRQFGKTDRSAAWPVCGKCKRKHETDTKCPTVGVWAGRGDPISDYGVVWLKRPMPDGGWPADPKLPRDDSFSWWVRSHCGHEGGAKQWAFYEERYADVLEQVFRANPCRYTRCADRIMIENAPRRS